jgi:hypothetical protein
MTRARASGWRGSKLGLPGVPSPVTNAPWPGRYGGVRAQRRREQGGGEQRADHGYLLGVSGMMTRTSRP